MKLSMFTDHCLRVLMYLATDPERRVTVGQISIAFSLSETTLTRVVVFLAKCKWVVTARGKGGGVTLAKSAIDIRVGQVVREAEGVALPADCADNRHDKCAILDCCELRTALVEAAAASYAVLDRYSLADITKNRQALYSLLYFRPVEKAGQSSA